MRGCWTGEGRPIVLLHGQPGSSADWGPVLALLAGHRLLVPDRPGYDGTPAQDWAGNAGALARLLAATHSGRVLVVGHSWGGGVALRMALDYPELVAGLCLIGSVGSDLAVTSQDRALDVLPLRYLGALLAYATPVLLPRLAAVASGSHASSSLAARLRSAAWHRLGPAAVSAFAVEQSAMVRDAAGLAADLPAVQAPTLVLTGSRDRTVHPAAARDLAHRLPKGSLRSVLGGHLLPLEQPSLVAEAIREAAASAVW